MEHPKIQNHSTPMCFVKFELSKKFLAIKLSKYVFAIIVRNNRFVFL